MVIRKVLVVGKETTPSFVSNSSCVPAGRVRVKSGAQVGFFLVVVNAPVEEGQEVSFSASPASSGSKTKGLKLTVTGVCGSGTVIVDAKFSGLSP